jgi:hypothetical protein
VGGVPDPTHRRQVEAILAGAAAERSALLEAVSPALRASLPVDATGITQAIEHLAAAVELADELRAEQAAGHRANPAVLHGRVYGRAPLSPDTVLAAFVDGARVRATVLAHLAQAIGGDPLAEQLRAVLAAHPLPTEDDPTRAADDTTLALQAAYAAQERAIVTLAAALDARDDT